MATRHEPKQSPWTTPADYAQRRGEYRRRSPAEVAREELLADWYGTDLAPLEIEAHQRAALDVSTVVDQLLGQWNLQDRVVLRQLVDRWGEVVGTAFRPHTQPRCLENRTLSIEVLNTVALNKLDQPQVRQVLLQKVRAVAGAAVTAIRFVPGGRSTSRPTGTVSPATPRSPAT